MKKKVLSMILAFAMIMVQIPASVYVLATDRDSGFDSAVVDSANASSTGWTIDDVLDLIDALPQADEVADESKVEVKIALNEALAAYSAAMEQDNIDAEELRDAVGDERRDKLRALSDLLSDVEIPVLDSGINAQMQADFEMGRLPLMSQMLLRGSSPTSAVIGSAENPFLIGTPEVLAELAELTHNKEEYGTDMPFAAANYQLVADIDLAGVDVIERITNFTGTFDGDGHVVKNMKTAGLFATAETGSVIKNLGIEDCKISCEGGAGGVAAYTNGTIMNCYVTGTISGIGDSSRIGGVVGEAGANAVVANCYAAGNVSGKSCVGGVVGVAQNATIANCYATGNISASGTVGGVVAWSLSSTVTDCAALGQTVTGNVNYGRVVGMSSGTISGCYAFSGMKIGPSGSQATVTGGAADNAKGADLSYAAGNAEGAKLSAQFSNIFGIDNTAWVYTADALPTLNNVDGDQSSELPVWFTSIMPTIFTISSAAQLAELRQLVNYGTASPSGYTNTAESYYNLTADIDLTSYSNWTPIGNLDNQFKGTFDGNGHVIENMTINRDDRDGGLFGYTAENSVIKNLGVENCKVTAIAYTGGVVGTCYGTVTNCYSTGSVNGSGENIGGVVGSAYGAVTNCYSTASVSGPYFVGGVVGSADGNVTGCYATGNVTGTNTDAGGVVGKAQGAIANCYSTGTVIGNNYAGGVAGEANNNITNCYSTGNITANGVRAGGVVGYHHGSSITNCAALGQTVTSFISGRIAGYIESGTVSNCYAWSGMKIGVSGSEAVVTDGAADNKNGADYTGGNPEFSTIFNGDAAWEYMSGALPTLKDAGGSQSNNLPSWIGGWSSMFAISTAAQLDELRQLVNNGTASASGYTNTAESYYYLTADIDLAESGNVTPIGLNDYYPFNGTFDGKGHAVQNMNVAPSDYAGLFGTTAENSTIKNLGVEDCTVTGEKAGGVVGSADGTVTNCYSTGTVSSGESSSSSVGGVVGFARGAVTNCYSTASVSGGEYAELGGVVGSAGAVTGCYATGSVSGGNHAGGVVGFAVGTVTNCFATGNVSGSVYASGGVVGYAQGTVTNCYAIGSVSGIENAHVGGVVGRFDSSTGAVTNCAALGKAATGVAASRIVSYIYDGTVSACYGWNGMSLSGDDIGDNGTDLTYTATNAAGAKLSAQFSAIFGDNAAWNYTADALPVLAGAGGSQSSDLPYWVVLGAGTEENPYIISTAAQLNDLRKVVNDGATSAYGYTNAAGRFYKLNANINLSGFDDDGDSTNGNWTPIGTLENRLFLGTFDGNGYAVKQMTIQLPSTDKATGLFGITAQGSVIKNLGIENCIVTGKKYTGGVAGFVYGTVTGCYVTGTISGYDFTGGVVGLSNYLGSVTRCYSTCSVNGNERVGGVVGYAVNSVTGCYASGSVTGSAKVGGVVGEASNSVISCVALGKTVTGNSASTGRVVGSCGFAPENCYAWRSMKIGESGSTAVVTDGAATNKNGADLLYHTEQGLLLGDALFTWPGFAENGWDVPQNQTSMPKLPYQASYPNIPTKLVQVLRLTLNYNNGTDGNTPKYAEYGNVTLPDKSDLAAMTMISDPKVFVGWDAQQSIADDAVPSYQAGDQFSLAQDTTLYAQWKTVSATINGKDADTGEYEVASYFDTPLQNQTTLTLKNNTFKAAENLDIKGWFQYPPDWLTITLTAEEGSDTATITFSGTPNSGSSNLNEPINIATSALTLPMDVEKFTSGKVHVSFYNAKPAVTWATAAQNVTYTTLETIITPPTVTLSGSDVYSGGFEYSYKTDASGTVYTNGLPTAVGTYYVKAHIDAYNYGFYSPADSDTDMTLTIAYLQTDAVAISDGTQGENGWFTSNVTLKAPEGYCIATSNDIDASWHSNLTLIDSDTNDNYIYYLREDSNGEITDAKTILVKRDTAVPEIGTVTYSNHQSFLDWIFHKSVIRVTVPVTDAFSGADHISYVLVPDGGTPLVAQTAEVDTDGNAVFEIEKTFKGVVEVKAYDKAGNLSEKFESKRMAVEEDAPTLVLEDAYANAYTNDWYTGTQWLYINTEDTGSGIQSVTCAVDGGSATTLFEAKETDTDITTNKVNPVVVQEGAHTYTVTVTDNALNTTSQTLTIKRDAIYPTVDSVTAGNITDTTLTVTAAASDDTSGVEQYYLYYEEGDVPEPGLDKSTCLTSTNGIFQLTPLIRNTTYTIFVWAEDTAGNISQPGYLETKTAKTSLEGATVTLGSSNFTYNGLSQTPSTITVTLGAETLTAGTDYTVSYSNSNGGANNTTNAGTVTVTVTAAESGNYSGAVSGTTYTITYLQTDAVAIADGTQGENGWFIGDVTIKAPEGYSIASANGSDAVWASSLISINVDTFTDMNYYLRKDSGGEITDTKIIRVKRDTADPVIGTLSYSVHQSFLDWIFHKSVIRVTVPVTDTLSGADHISYVLTPDGGTPQAAQIATVNSQGNAVFDVEKTFKGTVAITAYDKAGNASTPVESKRMAVEETAPTLTITDGANAFTESWYASKQTIDITALDTGSGIQSLIYAVDGGDVTTLFEAKEADGALTTSKNETVTVLEGKHTYTIAVTDNALNTTVQPVTIKQDTVSPTVDSVTPSNMTDKTLTITAAASDTTSGVKQYYLCYKEGEVPDANLDEATITSTNGTFQLTSLTRNTTYTIFVWVEDGAGNISEASRRLAKTAKTSLEGAAVALGSSNFTYNGLSQTPSAITVTLGGQTLTAGTDYTVNYSNSNGGANNTINVGTVTVTVTASESGNYSGGVTGKTYSIAPATPTVTWSETDKAQTVIYTGSPAVISAPQVTLVNSETYSGTVQYAFKKVDGFMNGLFTGYTDGLPTDAGKYLVRAHIAANGNYTAADSSNELELIIDKADATLSIKNTYTGNTYDGTPMVDPTAAQIESNITNPAVVYAYYADNSGVKGSHLSSTPVNAGTYWVEGSIAEANNTKAVTSAAVKFIINKAPLTISGGTVTTKRWDGLTTATVESITFSGLQNSESLAFGTDYTVTGAVYGDAAVGNGKNVIGGTVALATTEKANNYALSGSTLSGKGLTGNITKADGPASPTFKTWDDAANTFTFNSNIGTIYEYRINSTDNNDWTSVTASGGITVISVGNVPIPVGGLEVRVKNTDTHEAGVILTNTSEQMYTVSIEGGVSIDKTTGVTYGDTLTATASGYQTGAALHYQWTANGSNVGTDSQSYTVQSTDIGKVITITVTAAGYNSSLTPETTTNEVLKRSITVTAEAKSKTYGQTDPEFTYSITSGSLINGDTLSGALSRAGGETPNTYDINRGTLDHAAYIITYESANLTISKANVTLNVTVNPAAAKAGKTVTVTVSAVNAGSNLAASGWSQPAGVTLTDPNNSNMNLTPVAGKSGEYTGRYQIPAETAAETQLTFTAAVADTTSNYTNPQAKNTVLTVTQKSAVKLALTADKTSGVTYGNSVVFTAKVEKENPVLDLLNTLDGTVAFYLDGVKTENLLATKSIGDMLNVTLDFTKLTAGDHMVYAVYSGNAEFAAATQNVTTHVAAKSLAWDASGLSALKKYDGNSTANVTGTLLVTGVLESTDPGFSYTNLLGVYADVVAGSRTVTVTVNGAALTNINYALPTGNPTFTGKINAVSEITNVPESGNGTDYKFEQEFGISGVPDGLASNPDLNTPAKIEAQMWVSIKSAMNGVETANIEIYDITLLFSTDNDQTWQAATASNFPENGVTVMLPYPSGTNASDFDFVITHMFTTGANAGTTETIIPTKTAEGLKFTLHSLSPVAVGYKAATSNGSSGGSGGSGDSTDYNAEFWQSVENKINVVTGGDAIKVNAQYFDKMPYTVMDLLRKNDITLVIDWSNGNTITIPAGKAQQNEPGRIYWPLSKLAELYGDVAFVETPDTSGAQVNPETGGVGYIVYANTAETVPITGSVQKVEASITMEKAPEAQIPMAATPPTEGVAAIPAETAKTVAAVLALLAAAIGGIWAYRRKLTDK